MSATADLAAHVARVTPDQAAFYREHGWVHLPGLISVELAGQLLALLRERMEGGESRLLERDGHPRSDRLDAMWRTYELPSRDLESLGRFARSPQMASVAQALIGHHRGVRFWKDEVFLKLPTAEGGTETSWHQDSPYYPIDRFGSLTVWIALAEIRPEAGSLRFRSRSHRLGNLGRSFLDDEDPLDYATTELEALDVSPPLHLMPGDATVHNLATVHRAPANRSHSPRWAYTCGYLPADARYTGAPHRFTDGLGLEVGKRFDHDRFPLLSPPHRG
jgi:ectoine hydroxylase-related dioxygenase (phytanoyl-CoA dioxygenase family)